MPPPLPRLAVLAGLLAASLEVAALGGPGTLARGEPLAGLAIALGALAAIGLTEPALRPLGIVALALWLTPAAHFVAPMPEAGPLPRSVGAAALAAGVVAAAALLDRSAASVAERHRRVAYALAAVAATAALADRHLVAGLGRFGPDDVLAALSVLAVPLLAFAPATARRRDMAAAALAGLAIAASAVTLAAAGVPPQRLLVPAALALGGLAPLAALWWNDVRAARP